MFRCPFCGDLVKFKDIEYYQFENDNVCMAFCKYCSIVLRLTRITTFREFREMR